MKKLILNRLFKLSKIFPIKSKIHTFLTKLLWSHTDILIHCFKH